MAAPPIEPQFEENNTHRFERTLSLRARAQGSGRPPDASHKQRSPVHPKSIYLSAKRRND